MSPERSLRELWHQAEETVWLGDGQERVNTLTHGLGLLLSFCGVVVGSLAVEFGSPARRLAFIAYGLSLCSVFLFSTLSHAVRNPRLRNRMRAWDQGAIYLLIAGSYTPFITRFAPPNVAFISVTLMWSAAVLGFYTKVYVRHRVNRLATWSYVVLGWLPLIPCIGNVPKECGMYMFCGGMFYMLGLFFLLTDGRVKYFHAVWHLCVMIACGVHFAGILYYTP